MNPKVLQTISRHKRLETLLKNYTHVDENQRREAVQAVNPLGNRIADKGLESIDPNKGASP